MPKWVPKGYVCSELIWFFLKYIINYLKYIIIKNTHVRTHACSFTLHLITFLSKNDRLINIELTLIIVELTLIWHRATLNHWFNANWSTIFGWAGKSTSSHLQPLLLLYCRRCFKARVYWDNGPIASTLLWF